MSLEKGIPAGQEHDLPETTVSSLVEFILKTGCFEPRLKLLCRASRPFSRTNRVAQYAIIVAFLDVSETGKPCRTLTPWVRGWI